MRTRERAQQRARDRAAERAPAIEVRDLTRTYIVGESEVNALRGVTFSVQHGSLLSIMGASGSGKSTLMHLIGCLDSPTSGSIFIDGEDVSRLEDRELAAVRNRKIGFVFQQFNLLPRMSVLENVMTPLMYARVPLAERRRRASEALEMVGLAARRRHRPTELSGGQKQRVAIARALVTEPSIILADEPTGALDSATGQAILGLFRDINAEGRTVVIVTHDPAVGEACRSHIVIHDGQLEPHHVS